MLRHTFISHCVMRGVPLPMVKRWAGHSDLRTTMRYTHLAPENETEFMQRLSGDRGCGTAQGQHKVRLK